MTPLLSINIPTYNRSSYLKSLLESLADDKTALGDKVEINILDNASPDDTEAVARSFASKPGIHYQRHERNLGALQNIHLAHRSGTGKYVWIVGDDDYLQPGQLRRIVEMLARGPALVLLSYSRVTSDKRVVGKVSIGAADATFTKDSPQFSLAEVDSLIGFLSANIIERHWVDRFDSQAYDELDTRGELAHASMLYAAIAAGAVVQYIAGLPLAQTVDNGHLRHDVWVHVCVKYCMNLPEQLATFGFDASSTRRFFRRRLGRECVRRLLAEKYRGNVSHVVKDDPVVRAGLGWRRATLIALDLVPGVAVRTVYNALRTPRQ